MTSMIAQPQLMADAAANIEGIRSAIAAANAAAAGPTTGLAAAAADEVSAAAATLFGAYAQEYQAVIKQAAVFHDTFAQALATAATAYTEAEAANAAMVSGALRAVTSPIASLLGGGGAAAAPAGVAAPAPAALASPFDALIMTGSGTPIPSLAYMQAVVPYISGTPSQLIPLNTPEGLYPLTQIKDLPLTQSVTTGVQILHDALFGPQGMITAGGNVAVLGYSQSAILSSMEMRQLILQGEPEHGQPQLHAAG